MKHTFFYSLSLIIIFSISACSDTSQNTPTDNIDSPPSMGQPATLTEIEPQINFDPNQLTTALKGVCVQFKTLRGQDRKSLFDKIEPILPNCPVAIGEDNSSDFDFDNAMQRMSPSDLTEILGPPDKTIEEEEGAIVYYLTADESYRALFFLNAKGVVVCSAVEADS
jgi:hypothetical protein